MKRYTMYLDWKNLYCESDYTTQNNLQIQCNPHEIINDILHRLIQNILHCMETQKTQIVKAILRKQKNQIP